MEETNSNFNLNECIESIYNLHIYGICKFIYLNILVLIKLIYE